MRAYRIVYGQPMDGAGTQPDLEFARPPCTDEESASGDEFEATFQDGANLRVPNVTNACFEKQLG